jgi:hypothetical protein
MIDLRLSWRLAHDKLLRGYDTPVERHAHRGWGIPKNIPPNQKAI